MKKLCFFFLLMFLSLVSSACAQFGGGAFGDSGSTAVAGNPGGSDTQIQYNDGGSFGGDSGATTDGAGNLSVASVTTSASDGSNRLQIGNNTTRTPAAGAYELYPAGGVWYAAVNGRQIKMILGDWYFSSPDSGDCDDLNEFEDTCQDTTRLAVVYYDETNTRQWVGPKEIKHYRFAVTDSENLASDTNRSTKSIIIPPFDDAYGAVITKIVGRSDTDDYAFNLFSCASATDCGTSNDVLIDLVTTSTNRTSFYEDIQTTISSATVAAGVPIIFEHSSGTNNWVSVDIYYYLNGNVD